MLVSHILRSKENRVHSIEGHASVAEATAALAAARIGALLVMERGQRLVGIVSERDIVRTLAKGGGAELATEISALMTRDVISCSPEDTVDHVMDTMTHKRIRHLPVMASGRIVGVISIGDVVKALIDEARREAEDLKRYIAAG